MTLKARLKLSAMGLLVMTALFLGFALGRIWHWMTFLALLLSWMGDALLAHFPPFMRRLAQWRLDPFVAGMGAFALAQIAYIVGLNQSIIGMQAMYTPLPGYPLGSSILPRILPVYLLAGIMYWMWMVARTQKPRDLKIAVFIYSVLLATMGAFACAASFTGVRFIWPLLAGGLLFIISDGFIAAREFGGRAIDPVRYDAIVWGTYLPAQILLLIGTTMLY